MKRPKIAIVLIALTALVALQAPAADWPQFRGANRDGISGETGLLASWPPGGPRLVWKISGLGPGYSQPSVVGGRLYTQGQRGDKQYVFAFDAATGKKLWEAPAGPDFHHKQALDGPRGTPTIDSGRVFTLSAEGTLQSTDAATGRVQWSQNLIKQYGGEDPDWGFSESPLVEGNLLIAMPGGPGAAVIALDKTTGNLKWKTGSEAGSGQQKSKIGSEAAGCASAIAVDSGGSRLLLALTRPELLAMRPETGEVLWRYGKIFDRFGAIVTPVFNDNRVFVAGSFDSDEALLRLDGPKMTEVYSRHEGTQYFYYAVPVLVRDTLYSFANAFLTAKDFATGKILWKDRSVGKGSLSYADGRLYILGEDGALALIDPSPQAYREVSRFELGTSAVARTPPVIADGKLFVRVQDELLCYDIRKK